QDRAGPRPARAAREVGHLPAPPHLARPPRLPRPLPALRGVRARGSLPGEPRRARRTSARGESDEEAAVVVVSREDVDRHRLAPAPRGGQLELLPEAADAPF